MTLAWAKKERTRKGGHDHEITDSARIVCIPPLCSCVGAGPLAQWTSCPTFLLISPIPYRWSLSHVSSSSGAWNIPLSLSFWQQQQEHKKKKKIEKKGSTIHWILFLFIFSELTNGEIVSSRDHPPQHMQLLSFFIFAYCNFVLHWLLIIYTRA